MVKNALDAPSTLLFRAPVQVRPTQQVRRPVPVTSPTVAPAWSANMDARQREERQHAIGKVRTLERQHRDFYEAANADLLREAVLMSTRQLLDDLAADFGLAWADLARMVGVSVPAIRKWRNSGEATAENHERVARVWSFLTALRSHLSINDPVSWLGRRLEPGYTVTARHLWSPANVGGLLDLAAGGVSAVKYLDEIQPDWRVEFATNDEVVIADDGMPSIVRRSS